MLQKLRPHAGAARAHHQAHDGPRRAEPAGGVERKVRQHRHHRKGHHVRGLVPFQSHVRKPQVKQRRRREGPRRNKGPSELGHGEKFVFMGRACEVCRVQRAELCGWCVWVELLGVQQGAAHEREDKDKDKDERGEPFERARALEDSVSAVLAQALTGPPGAPRAPGAIEQDAPPGTAMLSTLLLRLSNTRRAANLAHVDNALTRLRRRNESLRNAVQAARIRLRGERARIHALPHALAEHHRAKISALDSPTDTLENLALPKQREYLEARRRELVEELVDVGGARSAPPNSSLGVSPSLLCHPLPPLSALPSLPQALVEAYVENLARFVGVLEQVLGPLGPLHEDTAKDVVRPVGPLGGPALALRLAKLCLLLANVLLGAALIAPTELSLDTLVSPHRMVAVVVDYAKGAGPQPRHRNPWSLRAPATTATTALSAQHLARHLESVWEAHEEAKASATPAEASRADIDPRDLDSSYALLP